MVRRRPSVLSPPFATIMAAVRMTERCVTVNSGDTSRIISVRTSRIPATMRRYCQGLTEREGWA